MRSLQSSIGRTLLVMRSDSALLGVLSEALVYAQVQAVRWRLDVEVRSSTWTRSAGQTTTLVSSSSCRLRERGAVVAGHYCKSRTRDWKRKTVAIESVTNCTSRERDNVQLWLQSNAWCCGNRIKCEFVVTESPPANAQATGGELGRSDINMTTNLRGNINNKRSIDVMSTLRALSFTS
jgi:hypothetical protein